MNANDGSLGNKKRDISALAYILKLLIILVLLVGGFLLVRIGVGLYEERLPNRTATSDSSAVMSEVPLTKSTKFDSEKSIDFFTKQCVRWEDEATSLRTAHELIKRDYIEKALERCNYVLSLNPSNRKLWRWLQICTLAWIGWLKLINAYIRLLNLDNKQLAVQEN